MTAARMIHAPLETIPGPVPGVIAFGRNLDACPHIPHCGTCGVEVATREDLLNARAAVETRLTVRLCGYVVNESDVAQLLADLDRQDARLGEAAS